MIGLYLFGIFCGILAALVLKSTKFQGNPVPFVMELPSYRMPSAKSVTLHMWEKAKDFLKRAFTTVSYTHLDVYKRQLHSSARR